MENRVYNFSAGPSMMADAVLNRIKEDIPDFNGTGTAVFEMSHRSKDYLKVIEEAKSDLRDLMDIPEDYDVLFLQGGGSLQFSMIPMNLAKMGDSFGYIDTGVFAHKAYLEGKKWGNAVLIASGREIGYRSLPIVKDVPNNLKFIHMTGNNTIYGSMFHEVPYKGDIPLVCDWSSAILGHTIDVKDYSLIYAGAQKNMGIAGVTCVILKKSILENEISDVVPSMLSYKIHSDNGSMYNTPPTFAIYVLGLTLKWIKDMGGVKVMEDINRKKAKLLYDYIDNSRMFHSDIDIKDRSIMNVTYNMYDESKLENFILYCKENGIINIKGHRALGGLRASIYNGMPLEGVEKLIEVMDTFEKKER